MAACGGGLALQKASSTVRPRLSRRSLILTSVFLLLSAFKLSHKGCGSSGGQNIWLGSNAPPPPPARPTSPEEILSSPDLPPPVPATTGICGSTTSTYGKSLDVPYEWVEVPGGAEVPVSGQVINVPVPS